MPRAKTAIESPLGAKALLVEGIDDWHAIYHIVECCTGAAPTFDLRYCGNDDAVVETAAAIPVSRTRTQEVVGLVLDSDSEDNNGGGIQHRIRLLKSKLGHYYEIPDTLPTNGLNILPSDQTNDESLPRLGIWLMPDNALDGIFEDLLRIAMNATTQAYISAVVDKAKADQIASYRPVERSKAIVRTHIAWQDPNKKNLGEAMASHFENLVPACEVFIKWIQSLFPSPIMQGEQNSLPSAER